MVHPTIKERIEAVGYSYEKMQRATAALKKG